MNLSSLVFLVFLNTMMLQAQSVISSSSIQLFLCGDIMTGRGIDQALANSSDPLLYETYVKDARRYLQLAEEENGPLSLPLSWDYPWGEALVIWQKEKALLKIGNLETSLSSQAAPWPGKGINYRMHPANTPLLSRAGFDFLSLANNHTLDWGGAGLLETLFSLDSAHISYAGAGRDQAAARAPAIFQLAEQRLLIFALALPSSGVPAEWAATRQQAGVNYLPDLGEASFQAVLQNIKYWQQDGDLLVLSIHWGDNWGYEVDSGQRHFAHRLIDEAGVDLIHGHSSHHPRPIEVYQERLILYGSGDFINDYEGIGGHEEFRPDLCLMYFPRLTACGALAELRLYPLQIRQFSLQKVQPEDRRWLAAKLSRESSYYGCALQQSSGNYLELQW